MPSITALLHTHNDALRLGRCLETLYPCDEILVVDGGSDDETVHVAREYGARVVVAERNRRAEQSLKFIRSAPLDAARDRNWILCLDPHESLSEALAASLYEWKLLPAATSAFSVFVREETVAGWISHPAAETRLVPHNWNHWKATLPSYDASAAPLEGELLRFSLP